MMWNVQSRRFLKSSRIIVFFFIVCTALTCFASASAAAVNGARRVTGVGSDDEEAESSVVVESPPLFVVRKPHRRSKMNNLDARPQVPPPQSPPPIAVEETANPTADVAPAASIIPSTPTDASSAIADVEVSELDHALPLDLRTSPVQASTGTVNTASALMERVATPGSTEFYVALAVVTGGGLIIVCALAALLLWWASLSRGDRVARRANPRYDGPPPKRLSKLSFRSLRYSMTGNQPLRSNRYRSSNSRMEPAPAAVRSLDPHQTTPTEKTFATQLSSTSSSSLFTSIAVC